MHLSPACPPIPLQVIYGLRRGHPSRGSLAATVQQLSGMLHGEAHPSEFIWHFVVSHPPPATATCTSISRVYEYCTLSVVPANTSACTLKTLLLCLVPCTPPPPSTRSALLQTSEGAAAEADEAYRNLLELERRSQGRVMSRPVSACTRVLAPLLLQEWQIVGSQVGDWHLGCTASLSFCAPGACSIVSYASCQPRCPTCLLAGLTAATQRVSVSLQAPPGAHDAVRAVTPAFPRASDGGRAVAAQLLHPQLPGEGWRGGSRPCAAGGAQVGGCGRLGQQAGG